MQPDDKNEKRKKRGTGEMSQKLSFSERIRAKVDPDSTALIIVDMQKGFCCKGGSFDKRGFDIIPAQEHRLLM